MDTTVRLLVVEDNEDEAFLLIHELKRAGYDVIWKRVDNEQAMRRALETDTWDIITSDHKMPRFSAPEALKLAKETAPDLPVIIVSGEIDLDLAVRLLKDGALDYVQKDKMPLVVPSVATALDLIKRKKDLSYSEDDAREISEKVLLATRSSGIGIWDYNPHTNTLHFDDTIYRIFGYTTPQEGSPRDIIDKHVDPDDRKVLNDMLTSALAQGTEFIGEAKITTVQGQVRCIRTNVFFDKDSTGKVTRILGTALDVTELKNSPTSSQTANTDYLSKRFELIATVTSTVVGEVSLKQQAEALCESIRNTFEADACIMRLLKGEELHVLASAGVPESKLFPSLPANLGLGKDILESGKPLRVGNIPETEYAVHLTPNDERRYTFVSYAGAPIKVQNRTLGIIAIYSQHVRDFSESDLEHLQIAANHIAVSVENSRLYEDVSRQKQELEDEIRVRTETEEQLRRNEHELEERVRQRTAQLEEANRELEAFSYSVSHDLRSPIRAIQGFSSILMKEYGDTLDADGIDALQRVIAASRKLNNLIDSMLSLSRVAREELHVSSVDLSEMAAEILHDLRTRHPERSVEFKIDQDMAVLADSRLMLIVMTNLLDNAWKFTQRKEEAVIEVGKCTGPEGDAFFVRDNGAGFNPSHANRLFAPFQRLHSDAEFEGTGVGLAIIHRVIQRHQGKIWAESEVGTGTTFFFTIGSER